MRVANRSVIVIACVNVWMQLAEAKKGVAKAFKAGREIGDYANNVVTQLLRRKIIDPPLPPDMLLRRRFSEAK